MSLEYYAVNHYHKVYYELGSGDWTSVLGRRCSNLNGHITDSIKNLIAMNNWEIVNPDLYAARIIERLLRVGLPICLESGPECLSVLQNKGYDSLGSRYRI
jgi:hypothetical protein